MKVSENFSFQKYIKYLAKSKVESLNRFLNLLEIKDIYGFVGKIEKESSSIDYSKSIEEIEDNSLVVLANSDLLYSIETDFSKREFNEYHLAVISEGFDALILLMKIVVDRLPKENKPIGVKIETLSLIQSLISSFSLYNTPSPPEFLGNLLKQIENELKGLKLLESQKTLLDYFPISDNDIINHLFRKLYDEGYTDKDTFPNCSEFVPSISEFSESQKIDNKIDWKTNLQELVYFSYLLYNKSDVYKGVKISKILPELFTVKGKPIKSSDVAKRLSDVKIKVNLPFSNIPKKWNKLSDIVSEISS